jgi:hypothetical protein
MGTTHGVVSYMVPGFGQSDSEHPEQPQRHARTNAQQRHLGDVRRLLDSLPDTPESELWAGSCSDRQPGGG